MFGSGSLAMEPSCMTTPPRTGAVARALLRKAAEGAWLAVGATTGRTIILASACANAGEAKAVARAAAAINFFILITPVSRTSPAMPVQGKKYPGGVGAPLNWPSEN